MIFLLLGRLGRNLRSSFAAVGDRKTRLSLCDVHTAAWVIATYERLQKEFTQEKNIHKTEALYEKIISAL